MLALWSLFKGSVGSFHAKSLKSEKNDTAKQNLFLSDMLSGLRDLVKISLIGENKEEKDVLGQIGLVLSVRIQVSGAYS